jgi:adenylate kinase
MILMGPPGAGKGTQAKVLAKQLSLAHISTGDLLRQNVADGSELGKKAKEYMDAGALVPDELVTEMLISRFSRSDIAKGFILDGYPRTINQAQSLDEVLKSKNMPIDLVVDLNTSERMIVQRLSGRLVCRKCAANFHKTNMPPKKPMICDNCNGELYQRPDDNEATIMNRLAVYRKDSAPLIKYYADKGKLQSVPADGAANDVLNIVVGVVKKYNDSHKV